MALRTIRLDDDEILRKKSKPVNEINEKIFELLDDMAETLHTRNGVGLAAPQVGVLKRIAIIETDEKLYELINPEILEVRGSQTKTEGCLSLPGKAGIVERPEYVKLRALNRNGEEIIVEGEDLLAIALCHETDHLDGILYTDKVIRMVDINADGEYDEDETDEADDRI